MAKKPVRRRQSGFFVARVSGELALGSLAAGVVIVGNITNVSDRPLFLIAADLTWIAKDITPGEGPIVFGLAHSDYSAAEVEEWFEQATGFVFGDMVEKEQAGRKCREIGAIDFGLADGQGDARFNDGKQKRTKLGFAIQSGQTLNMFARNMDGTALTTGTEINASGRIYGRKL